MHYVVRLSDPFKRLPRKSLIVVQIERLCHTLDILVVEKGDGSVLSIPYNSHPEKLIRLFLLQLVSAPYPVDDVLRFFFVLRSVCDLEVVNVDD